MKRYLVIAIFFSLLLNSGILVFAQNPNNDSLIQKSYSELYELLNNSSDTAERLNYANAYLIRAKNDNDPVLMGNAYCILVRNHNLSESVLYADTLLMVTKNIKGNRDFPTSSYIEIGNLYYLQGDYKKALDQYLLGIECEKINNNAILHSILQVNIGLLKNILGQKSEALSVFREYVKFIKESEINDKEFYLLNGLFNLGDSYILNQRYDSASTILAEGIELSLKQNNTEAHAIFLIYFGANLFFEEKYSSAIDSLLKGQLICTDKSVSAYGNLFIGKSYGELHKLNEAILYFTRLDSLLNLSNNVTPELLEAYPVLINYYSAKKDIENELYFTKNLLKYSAILEKNNQYLSQNISLKYDLPKLLASKEELITKLNRDKLLSKRNLLVLSFITVLLFSIIIYYRWKNNIYKKRFDILMLKTDSIQDNSNSISIEAQKDKSNDITDELVQQILFQLAKFEQSNKFTKKNYTLISLAKELNTNSTYLSKVINDKKGINFANYLNNLKIDFAVSSLKDNAKLRSFTIEAIAKEFGFNTAQSFSAAFHKKTGIYPSFFIKQLEK